MLPRSRFEEFESYLLTLLHGFVGRSLGVDSLPVTARPAEQRHARIAVVAFRLAESRGFAPGGELEDWLRAESEIDGQSAQ
jgi:hypothetical protein